MSILCTSYCSHGGRCELKPGHDVLHNSGYCTWPDAEALTREAADAVLYDKPGGAEFLATGQPLADLLESSARSTPLSTAGSRTTRHVRSGPPSAPRTEGEL